MAMWRALALRLLIQITNENTMTRQSALYAVCNINVTFLQSFNPKSSVICNFTISKVRPKCNTCSDPEHSKSVAHSELSAHTDFSFIHFHEKQYYSNHMTNVTVN